MTERKHFVTLLSPGTLFDEQTTRAITTWDPREAVRMASEIVERHGATPYGFQFSTRIVADPVPDGEGGELHVEPKVVAKSGTYFINGKLRTLDEIEALDDPNERILQSNMRCNRWFIVCEVVGRYRSTHPFEERDFVVSADGAIVERGDSESCRAYRARKLAELNAGGPA